MMSMNPESVSSLDYTRYPTLAPLPEGLLASEDFLRCCDCGGTDFLLRGSDGAAVCRNCGREWTPRAAAAPKPANPAQSKCLIPKSWAPPFDIIGACCHYIAVLSPGGIVKTIDKRYRVHHISESADAITASCEYLWVLHADETVTVHAPNGTMTEKMEGWTNIAAISAGGAHIVGLRYDGTVLADGRNQYGQCRVQDWSGITAIAACTAHTIGLRFDGTVVAAGDNTEGQCNVEDWSDIKAITTGMFHTVGLRKNGTVVAVGNNLCGQCNVSDWYDITDIAVGAEYTVGLRSDGTAVAVGINRHKQCNVHGWNNIHAITADCDFTSALRNDGKLLTNIWPLRMKLAVKNALK